jgi:glutathione S-transferase
MPLTLYGSARSTARVLVIILEKNLPYHFIKRDISCGHLKPEEFLNYNHLAKSRF